MADRLFFCALNMHIKLDQDYLSLSEVSLRAHEAIIDRLLYAHLAQEHLFCLTPAEIIRLRSAIQFGPQARRALDIIQRRQQDYNASLRAADWHIVLRPLGDEAAKVPLGKQFYVTPEDAHLWLQRPPSLFVENGMADGAILTAIMKVVLPSLNGSVDLVVIRSVHGGGSSLADLLRESVTRQSSGMCVCDRDTPASVPPFPNGSTGAKVDQALREIGLIEGEASEPRAIHPFFYFQPTSGWGLENYVGPTALTLFFSQAPECQAHLDILLSRFPDFPTLNEIEREEWQMINLKSENQDAAALLSGATGVLGPAVMTGARASDLAGVSIPGSVVPFVKSASKAGRYHRPLVQAFRTDLAMTGRIHAAEALARGALTVFAADSRINFA